MKTLSRAHTISKNEMNERLLRVHRILATALLRIKTDEKKQNLIEHEQQLSMQEY